jgi:hypothetical protein
MLRVGLFVALLLAGAEPAAGDPADTARLATGGTATDQTFNRPIDLNFGFHPARMPLANEDSPAAVPREPESPGAGEFPAHPSGLPRSGPTGIMSKREHMATFRLQGVTIFGGSIAGSVDGRSANILLSWSANP